MSIAPQWLQNIAAANPLLYAVDAARHIFNDNLGDPSVAKGVLILAVLSVVAVVIGARQFGRGRLIEGGQALPLRTPHLLEEPVDLVR